MNSKELVLATLEFRNTDGRVPRAMGLLPWTVTRYPETIRFLEENYPPDNAAVPLVFSDPPKTYGDQYAIGQYTDEWGCVFTNYDSGIIGEVKTPLVLDDDWVDADKVHLPEELLSFDVDKVNEFCRASDKFTMSSIYPRPFEQLQFIRGTENLYMDLMDPPKGMLAFLEKMHNLYCRLITKFASETEVDCIPFMDDWGSQQNLLINPGIWNRIFKPMYKDFIDITHKYGKKAYMHTDGHILEILPQLIELGLDVVNPQVFCMGIDKLAPYAGKITFWGELDRQQLLPHGTPAEIDRAVEELYAGLWKNNGGAVAMCEFGPSANPENVVRFYKKWAEIR